MIKKVLSLFTISLAVSSTLMAEKVSYNVNYAVSYAYKYVKSDSSPFPKHKENCTNFANQVLLAGITKKTDAQGIYDLSSDYEDKGFGGYSEWYFDKDKPSHTWKGANELHEYVKNQVRLGGKYEGWYFEKVTHDTHTKFMDYQKVKRGDIIFADWKGDGIFDHTMVVTNIQWWRYGYDEIRVTYQSNDTKDRGLGDINEEYNYKALFYVYRPKSFKK